MSGSKREEEPRRERHAAQMEMPHVDTVEQAEARHMIDTNARVTCVASADEAGDMSLQALVRKE